MIPLFLPSVKAPFLKTGEHSEDIIKNLMLPHFRGGGATNGHPIIKIRGGFGGKYPLLI